MASNNNLGTKFLTPWHTHINIWPVSQFQCLELGSLIRLLMLIIDTMHWHIIIYQFNIGCNLLQTSLGLTWLVTAAFTECFLIKLWPWMSQVQIWKSNGELHTARPQLQNVYSVLELWVEHKCSLRPGQQSLRSVAVAKAEPRQALETHSHTRSAQQMTKI